ncbi:MAG: HD domain-containing protein [Eubacteriales bacterium]|nr:HD domain-containing protein [Eubacteriales bacterium]
MGKSSMQYLQFIKEMEQLKNVTRTAWTSDGHRESTAEHSWRLAMLAGVMLAEFPELDAQRVLMLALVHDMGELYEGDKSAADFPDAEEKYKEESEGVQRAAALLEEPVRSSLIQLWEEYEAGETREARLVKALDKAETIIQHNQGANPVDFDYQFNLNYGKELFSGCEILEDLRRRIDEETRENVQITNSLQKTV